MLRRALLGSSRHCRDTSLRTPAACRSASSLRAPHVQTIGALLDSGSPGHSATGDVEVNGFIRSVRKQKRVAFAALSDGSTLDPLQVVLTPGQAEGLSTGVAVKVSGRWVPSPGGKQQSHELQAERVAILGANDATSYPIQKKYQTVEFLRTLPHLRSRIPLNNVLLRLRSQVIASLTSFFEAQDFIQTHTPILTSSDCEGAGEVFTVQTTPASQGTGSEEVQAENFFRSPKYLTVSAQLHLEALAQSVNRVWTLSPTFRAEKSDTPRHLSEFYMLEAEMCFVEDMGTVMTLIEDMLRAVTASLQQSRLGEELLTARAAGGDSEKGTPQVSRSELEARWKGLTAPSWPHITYQQAVMKLQKAVQEGVRFVYEPVFGASLQAEHEKYLASAVGEGRPIFVTDYPRDVKAFYMSPSDPSRSVETGPDTVACFDLLVPDLCELAGGSMREHRYDALYQSMRSKNMRVAPSEHASTSDSDMQDSQGPPATDLDWYLDLRRYGSVPHGGFGLGFDRLLSYLSGTNNIRDIVTFPRWYGRCDC